MGFWDHLFDSDYKQRMDIEALRRSHRLQSWSGAAVEKENQELQGRVGELEERVGELALLCRSLLTLLREDGTVDPQRFEEVMTSIDGEDGVVDGKITPEQVAADDESELPKIRTRSRDGRIR